MHAVYDVQDQSSFCCCTFGINKCNIQFSDEVEKRENRNNLNEFVKKLKQTIPRYRRDRKLDKKFEVDRLYGYVRTGNLGTLRIPSLDFVESQALYLASLWVPRKR